MADGIIAGKLEIPVEADLSTFEERLKRKVEAAADRINAKVKVVLDGGEQMRADLESAVHAAVEGVEAKIKAVIDTDGLRASLVAAVDEASAGVTASVKATLDADQLRGELEAKAKAAAEGFELKVKTSVDGVVGQVVEAEKEAQVAADADPVKVPVKLNEKDLSARLLEIIAKLRAEADAAPAVKVKTKVDESGLAGLKGLLRPGLYLGIASLIQPLIALLGQAAAGAGALVSAISPAIGALGALPGVIATAGIALATLKIGFGGFTKAIQTYAQAQKNLKKTTDAVAASHASIAKGLAKLSPAEQQAVKNYNSLRTAQAGYAAQRAKLTPQEAAAVRAVQRLNGSYQVTAKAHSQLQQQLRALNPQQQQAVNSALKLAAAGKSTTASLRGLSPQAQQVVKDMRALQTQNKQVTAAQKAVDAALKDLSPSAKTAALAIYGLQGAWKTTKKTIQESIFSQFASDIEPAAKTLLPLLSTNLSKVGAQLGGVVKQAIAFAQTPLFKAQFRILSDQAATSVGVLGHAGLGLATAFGNVAVASIPLQNRMLGVISRFGAFAANATSGVAAGAKMQAFFKDAGNTAGQLSRILLDVGKALFGIFKAGRGAGNTLLDGIERQAHRLLDYVNSPKGFASIKSYFDDAVPGAKALASLVGALLKSLGHLSRDNGLASMLNEMRDKLVPALETLLGSFGRNLGPQVVDTVSELAKLFGNLSSTASPLAVLVKAVASLASAINAVLGAVPGLGAAISILLGIAAVTKVWKLATGALTTLIVKIASMRAVAALTAPVMDKLGLSVATVGKNGATASKGLQSLMGKLGTYGAIVSMLGTLNTQVDDASIKTGTLSKAFSDLTRNGKTDEEIGLLGKGFGDLGSQLKELSDPGLFRRYDDIQNTLAGVISFNQFGDTAGSADRTQFIADLKQVDDGLAQLVQSGNGKQAQQLFDTLNQKAIAGGAGIGQLASHLPAYNDAMKQAATATGQQGAAAAKAAPAVQTLGAKMSGAAAGADKMKSALDGLLGLFQSQAQAQAGFEQDLASLPGKLGKATKAFLAQHGALDLTTQSGRDLQGQLISMIQDNAAVADAIERTTGSTKKANAAWNDGISRIKQHLEKLGLTPAAAQKVIDKLGGIKDAVKNVPKLAQLKIAALGANDVLNALALIDGKIVEVNKKKVTVRMTTDNGGGVSFQTGGKTRKAFSVGGLFRGKGSDTEDANTVRISNNEFIVRAARAKKFRALLEAINSGSEQSIQAALAALSGAGHAVAGVASRAAGALSAVDLAGPAPARRAPVGALRPVALPVSVAASAPVADTGARTQVLVDQDGQLLGRMKVAAQKTHAQRTAAARLGNTGTWGVMPA